MIVVAGGGIREQPKLVLDLGAVRRAFSLGVHYPQRSGLV
jgi:hypothetical protein